MTSDAPGADAGLLLIDLQNDFIHPNGLFARNGLRVTGLDALLDSVNQLVAAAREAGRPVYWVTMVWDSAEDGGLLVERSPMKDIADAHRRGSWGACLHERLDVQAEDRIVEKRRFSAFFDTDMHDILRRDGISSLVVGGVRTDFCVESTVRDAFFHDYAVSVVEPAVAGYVPDLHANSLRQMGTVFAQVVPIATAKSLLAAG